MFEKKFSGCRRFNAVETVVFAFIILCAFLLKLLSYLSNGSMKSALQKNLMDLVYTTMQKTD